MFEGDADFQQPKARAPYTDGLNLINECGHFLISAVEPHHLVFGQNKIDLSDIKQLMEKAQTLAIGRAIEYAKRHLDGRTPLREIVEKDIAEINQDGLDTLDEKHIGNLVAFRGLDLAAALIRFRDLIIDQEE